MRACNNTNMCNPIICRGLRMLLLLHALYVMYMSWFSFPPLSLPPLPFPFPFPSPLPPPSLPPSLPLFLSPSLSLSFCLPLPLPLSPRDGSAVELVALCYSAVTWLSQLFKQSQYPYQGVTLPSDSIDSMQPST